MSFLLFPADELVFAGTVVVLGSETGPIMTFESAPDPKQAADRVAHILSRDAAGDSFGDLIDITRTPVLRWRRSYFRQPGCLIPALLQNMPAPGSLVPPDLTRLYRSADRWLKSHGRRINPFEHCPPTPVPVPRNVNRFAVWVHAHAGVWLESGGQVWPWTA